MYLPAERYTFVLWKPRYVACSWYFYPLF